MDDCFGRRVRTVIWKGAKIEDLNPLKEITKLRDVMITNSEIGDISVLGEIPSIRMIELVGSDVDDLTPLKSLPNLEHLNVNRTSLTDAQVKQFADSKPNCRVLHSSIPSN